MSACRELPRCSKRAGRPTSRRTRPRARAAASSRARSRRPPPPPRRSGRRRWVPRSPRRSTRFRRRRSTARRPGAAGAGRRGRDRAGGSEAARVSPLALPGVRRGLGRPRRRARSRARSPRPGSRPGSSRRARRRRRGVGCSDSFGARKAPSPSPTARRSSSWSSVSIRRIWRERPARRASSKRRARARRSPARRSPTASARCRSAPSGPSKPPRGASGGYSRAAFSNALALVMRSDTSRRPSRPRNEDGSGAWNPRQTEIWTWRAEIAPGGES